MGAKQAAEKFLRRQAGEPVDNSKAEKARAYAQGLPSQIATDTALYLDMTLREIADEWRLADPVELLVAISIPELERKYTKAPR